MFIEGPAGKLEAIKTTTAASNVVAILCHPHPLYQGTMHNKVVTTMAKACDELGFSHIRFNYRGVGQSAGEYGDMEGEIADALAVLAFAKNQFLGQKIVMMGFSFGSYISARVAKQQLVSALVTIAPAVNHADFQSLTDIDCPWLAIGAGNDEVIPVSEVEAFFALPPSPMTAKMMPEASHFFHGRLLELRQWIVAFFS